MIIVLGGVAGSGKTTVGRLLATDLRCPFIDADDLHPAANVEKMRSGIPLDDADRAPWLDRVRRRIEALTREGKNGVIACSALKASYRDRLRVDESIRFVLLKGARDLLEKRLRARRGHFMSAALLASQLADLEESAELLIVDAAASPEEITARIRAALHL